MVLLSILYIFTYLHVESTSNTVIQRHKSCFSWFHSNSSSILELQKAAAFNMRVSCSDPRTNNVQWRMFANLEHQHSWIITLPLCRNSYKSLIPTTSHHQFQFEATLHHHNFSYFENVFLLKDQNKTLRYMLNKMLNNNIFMLFFWSGIFHNSTNVILSDVKFCTKNSILFTIC